MKILLAAPDRDLLAAYEKLLDRSGHAVTTAFDGPQVLELLAAERFDLAALDRRLPRADLERIVSRLRSEDVFAVVLQDHPPAGAELQGAGEPHAFLTYPFLPSELLALPGALAAQDGEFAVGDRLRVDARRFRFLNSDVLLSLDELTLLRQMAAGEPGRSAGACAAALNAKLAALPGGVRVRFTAEKGFQLVNEDA